MPTADGNLAWQGFDCKHLRMRLAFPSLYLHRIKMSCQIGELQSVEKSVK
jgi:hypothetical protein